MRLINKEVLEAATKLRSSHQKCFVRKGVLRNFTKFTGKKAVPK